MPRDIPARAWGSGHGVNYLLLLAVLITPAVLFTLAAYDSYEQVVTAARDRVGRTAMILREHAQRVFETQELVLARIEDRVRGQTDAEIARPEMSALLGSIADSLEQTASLWIASSDGTVLAGSQPWPSALTLRQNALWLALRERDERLHISDPFTGRATGVASIAVGRRLPAEDGSFRGTMHAALSSAYFQRVFSDIAGPVGHRARLLRDDGRVLVQDPPDPAVATYSPDHPLMRAIAASPDGGTVAFEEAGQKRLVAFFQVPDRPVYVTFGIDRGAMLAEWWHTISALLFLTLAASIALAVAAMFALRQTRVRQAALDALGREIAQREATERRLRDASRLEAVGRITGGVAHDFNNLLTTILVSLDLVEARPSLDGEGLVHVRGARKAAETGARLVASLLAYARGQVLAPERIDAAPLVADMMPLLRNGAGEGIDLTLTAEPGLPLCIADPAQLRAALMNLVLNARDAMPGGGELRITLAERMLDGEALAGNSDALPGRFLEITVADTGSGIATEHLPRVFEPFFTTKEVGKGTGLGLSQVFGFVRQSAGHVRLESEPGRGTVIRLFLPAAGAPVPAAASPAVPAPPAAPVAAGETAAAPPARVTAPAAAATPRAGQRRRVLVVDDMPALLGLARTILDAAGYAVDIAPSADAAAQMIDAGERFDLVISDVVMPGQLDGFGLVDHLAGIAPGMPVILMSGFAPEPARLARCSARFLGKPFTRQALLEAVSASLVPAAA
jgi:signal transduction histidine kinase